MLLPTVTWGDLRSISIDAMKTDTIIPDDLLADPEMFEMSRGKPDEEYVWPEQAEEFLEFMKSADQEDPEPVTAAGEPSVEEEGEFEFPSPLYFTVDDDDMVLELVKMEDEGLFIRIEGKWVDISAEDEFPTVYEQTIHFANDESVGKWDAEFEENEKLTLADISDYIIK